jgi:hypothetical protein
MVWIEMQSLPDARPDAVAGLLERAAAEATGLGHRAAAQRFEVAAGRLRRSGTVVLVAGPPKSGKSTLTNALCGAELCPADPLLPTAAPTVVTAGTRGRARVRRAGTDDPVSDIDLADLAGVLLDADGGVVELVEIQTDAGMPASGVTLIDTAGMTPSPGLLEIADAAVVAVDPPSVQEGVRIAADVRQAGPVVLPVVTKVDLYPEWRRSLARFAADLRAGDTAIPPVPVSAELALEEPEAAAETGIGALQALIETRALGPGRHLAADRSRRQLIEGLDELIAVVADQLACLDDPERAAQRRSGFDEARRRTDAVRRAGGRWHLVLQEGFADLTAETDAMLRSEVTRLAGTTDEAIETADPVADWDRLARELAGDLGRLSRRLHRELVAGSSAVAARVAATLGEEIDSPAVGLRKDIETSSVLGDAPTVDEAGAVSRGLDVLRGSYGGVLVAGMVGQLVALPITAPLTLGAGMVFGLRHAAEQRRRRLQQWRLAARKVVRGHLDGVQSELSARIRREIRTAQSAMRDAVERRIETLGEEYRRLAAALEQPADPEGLRRRRDATRAGLDRLRELRAEAETVG